MKRILKYSLFLVVLILCICISPVLGIGITQNNTVIPSNIIELVGGGERPPVAYLGEYVDLSQVVGWTGQLGFWYGDPITGSKPDIIVDASSFQHKFWLDPAKFKVGYWYKWDGAWSSAENTDAFEIRAGIRPIPVPTEYPAYNGSIAVITPITTPTPEEQAPIHIILARGDEITYYYNGIPSGNSQAHIWLFGQLDSILGDDMEVNKTVASYAFREEVSEKLRPGWYYGYLQFSAHRPDVWYNASHKIGDDYYTKILETPYDDTVIADIDVAGLLPAHIQSDFEKLESNTEYSHDTLVKITMEVVDPEIRFIDYYEEDDNIVINGNSTVRAGTNISFVIDPDRWTKGVSLNSHTFTTQLVGNINEQRRFHIEVPVNWDEMALGWHVVTATLDRLKIHLSINKEFEIKETWVNPTPTQARQKVLLDGNGWHVVNVTPTPTPTPQIVYITQTPQIVYVYVTTTGVTPSQTPAQPVPTTQESPLSEVVAIIALVVVGYAVMRRR